MNVKAFSSSFINKFIYLKRAFGNKPFRLLDIGAGNHSATKAKTVFKNCEYHGVDREKDYNNTGDDFKQMDAFYEMDLTRLDFSSIPNNYFDALLMVHVIEHLYNGDEVIKSLLSKLKSGSYIYIEYPGQKSTRLPSMPGTLNFKDDDTHVRVYSVKELSALLETNGCKVLKGGVRRNIWFMMAMPFKIIKCWVTGKKLQGNIFWDVLGFAEYVWARKN
ncbi:MAG: class I SAM-dependent methyltransferase [Ferruginibacter sp.]|nr:class I SAM-dependent methyltransferase [Bacteroidota bacterium]MBX2920062.1 class I SAM-dependent methyltransferase [Ferruginibacter sp.]MCB0710075.1 class I SAM-dependent methyltransferase [Chitinophagaceae bacterium]MCC7379398.1 class I SAM-dependent methyltransferase [Chitinophagaceae bacterium]